MIDEIRNPLVTLKAIGHQWYWTYEYSDFKKLEFDSYIISQQNLNKFNFRLLEVDNRTILPYISHIRLLTSSADVIHSWTIPSSGVKIDASPGRLNQIRFNLNRTGIFFGQCSEICGANHRFIPISIERVSPKIFIQWIEKFSLDDWKKVMVS